MLKAMKALSLPPRRACSLGQLASLVSHSSMITDSSTNPIKNPKDGTVTDSSEFLKWHNGGGFFHRSASIDPTVLIEIGSIVHRNTVLGTDVRIGSGTVIGPSVSIAQSTTVGYNAVLSNCSVGISCTIHNGVCIGQDGFGFFLDEEGCVIKKPQMLHVKIGDHVEIGSNTCIDRGSWRDTVIGDYAKIDNLVQIGHNVTIGKCCIICGQVGLAGSVTMGDYVTLGGRVAVRDHVSVASKVRLAANSSVTKDITEPGDYGGFPAVPIHEWRRQAAVLRRYWEVEHASLCLTVEADAEKEKHSIDGGYNHSSTRLLQFISFIW